MGKNRCQFCASFVEFHVISDGARDSAWDAVEKSAEVLLSDRIRPKYPDQFPRRSMSGLALLFPNQLARP